MMRNNSAISLYRLNGLPKHQNKDSDDIEVDGNEGDFYWYQILILSIQMLFLKFFLIPRQTYKSIWKFHSAIFLRCPWTKRHKCGGARRNYWLCETCKALTSSYFNFNLKMFFLDCGTSSNSSGVISRARDGVLVQARFLFSSEFYLQTSWTWNILTKYLQTSMSVVKKLQSSVVCFFKNVGKSTQITKLFSSVCVYARLFSFPHKPIQTETSLQIFIFQKCQKMEKFSFIFCESKGDVLVRIRVKAGDEMWAAKWYENRSEIKLIIFSTCSVRNPYTFEEYREESFSNSPTQLRCAWEEKTQNGTISTWGWT